MKQRRPILKKKHNKRYPLFVKVVKCKGRKWRCDIEINMNELFKVVAVKATQKKLKYTEIMNGIIKGEVWLIDPQ